ncbi:ADP-ribosylglycohydrolase family protein [Kocuria marina]|uniref:ADP-ribosylglycohydrolase family protein n=1 Tax=Kocuria marina TaxID=223184 RepID=UPI0011A6D66A|nr:MULTISPECIES: ADP-ribosylglycohydrolase family protein [Kocuria]MCT2021078.1 ADP-ribosylglycohydrolase family protein [Kocuria marina]
MTSPHTPELLEQDRGLDAASSWYPSLVRSVFLAPWRATATERPGEATQLLARTAGALNEVAHWANDGQAADPTACAWLAYLRWAARNGARLPDDAPHPPADDLDRDYPLLSAPGEHAGDGFTALSTGRLGEVTRPVLPLADSAEILARTLPYGLVPHIGWKSLVALAVDSAAITHGSAEAQTAAVGAALTVHAAARARDSGSSLQDAVEETGRVVALMTRPAPLTRELLDLCADRFARDSLFDGMTEPAGAFARAVGDGTAASSALALGLAAALCAVDAPHADNSGDDIAQRALALLSGHPAANDAARTVAVGVAAARWGLGDAAHGEDIGESDNGAPGVNGAAGDDGLVQEDSVVDDNSRTTKTDSGTDTSGTDPSGTRAATRRELLALANRWLTLWRPHA